VASDSSQGSLSFNPEEVLAVEMNDMQGEAPSSLISQSQSQGWMRHDDRTLVLQSCFLYL
jgi:hypothetical protein